VLCTATFVDTSYFHIIGPMGSIEIGSKDAVPDCFVVVEVVKINIAE